MAKKVTRSPRGQETHSWDAPENGLWWHALSGVAATLFAQKNASFGTDSDETCEKFAGQRIVKFRPCRNGVESYLPKDGKGALLVLAPNKLAAKEWCEFGQQGDRHVLASAVLRPGVAQIFP